MRHSEGELNKKLAAKGFINSAEEDGVSFGIKESRLEEDRVLNAVMSSIVARYKQNARVQRAIDTHKPKTTADDHNEDDHPGDDEDVTQPEQPDSDGCDPDEVQRLFETRKLSLTCVFMANQTHRPTMLLLKITPGVVVNVWWDNADKDGNIDRGSYWRGIVGNYLPDQCTVPG